MVVSLPNHGDVGMVVLVSVHRPLHRAEWALVLAKRLRLWVAGFDEVGDDGTDSNENHYADTGAQVFVVSCGSDESSLP